MLKLHHGGMSSQKIKAFFAAQGRFVPLALVELVLGREGGLTAIPGFEFVVRGVEQAPLLDSRTIAFAAVLKAQDALLRYDDMLNELASHGFYISQDFYMQLYSCRRRWNTPITGQEYL